MLKHNLHLHLTFSFVALAAIVGCSEPPQGNPQPAAGGAGIVAIGPQPPAGNNAPANNIAGGSDAPANPAQPGNPPASPPVPPGENAADPAAEPAGSPENGTAGAAAPAEYAAFALPVALYYQSEDKIADLFEEVAGGLAPAEAAPRLTALAAEYRPRIRPYWLWAATATNDQKNEEINKRFAMLNARHGGKPPMLRTSDMIDLARQPGNDSFKAALAALFQAQIDTAPRLHAAQAQKLLDQLNR
jgi:hypothetical protein